MRAGVVVVVLLLGAPAAAESPGPTPITVGNVAELQAAFAEAMAGDIIELLPGTYDITASLTTASFGPITVRAAGALGSVVLQSSVVEAIRVTQPYWTFQRLEVRGVCTDDSTCEHAFHVTGLADGTRIETCRLVDFNAQIKGNGAPVGPSSAMVWPDDVSIALTELFDTRPRQTANPVTKIDVVGGRRWQLVGNYIHTFEKAGGDQISYGAFLKGNSRDGLMHRNRVVCGNSAGSTAIGLSLGGGGSAPDSICEDATCTPEHQGGVIQDNLIAMCSDVGIYLNEAMATTILHNTIYQTAGVDVRFPTSTATVTSNLIGGVLRDRDGGSHVASANLVGIMPAEWSAWFTNPADALEFGLLDGTTFVDQGAQVVNLRLDFCGNDRDDGAPDIGAVEYDIDLVAPTQFCSPRRTEAQDAATVDAPTADAAGPGATGDGGGCGCRTGGGGGPTAGLALLALGFLTARRRR